MTTPRDQYGSTASPEAPAPQSSFTDQISALEERLDSRANRRDGWSIFMLVFSCIALIGSVIAVGYGSRAMGESKAKATATVGTAAAAPATAVAVGLSEYKIDPAELTVATGGTLQVMNTGKMQHNLAVQNTQLVTPMLEGGGTSSLSLASLAAGTYTVICSQPGHEQLGMTATLHVVGATASAAGSATTATTQPMTSDQMDAVMAASMKAFPAKTAGLGAQVLAPSVLPDGTKQFSLTAKVVKWEVSPGTFVDAWTYNGSVPGPTLKVNPGDKVQVVLLNQLPESTVIHFHGLIVPNAMDGVPYVTQPPVKPGQSFTYSWTAQSTPAVGMYHSHDNAVKQVPDGLAGAFLVGDEPVPAGITVSQTDIMMLNDSGTIGLTINGKGFPATAPIVANLGDWVEVHYMNEGQMTHPMHLHGLAQLVIAEDGYAVPTPYQVDTVSVAPGQRFTVLVHADNPGTWVWHCHILSHAENDQGMFGMVTAMVVKGAAH